MIMTMHSDQNASPLRIEVITRQSSGVAVGRPPRRSGWSRRRCSPGCRFPTWPGEQASLPACCSTGVDECWKAACKRSRLTKNVVGTSRVRELERRVRELERLLGRKTMEVEILKEALDAARVKKPSLHLRRHL